VSFVAAHGHAAVQCCSRGVSSAAQYVLGWIRNRVVRRSRLESCRARAAGLPSGLGSTRRNARYSAQLARYQDKEHESCPLPSVRVWATGRVPYSVWNPVRAAHGRDEHRDSEPAQPSSSRAYAPCGHLLSRNTRETLTALACDRTGRRVTVTSHPHFAGTSTAGPVSFAHRWTLHHHRKPMAGTERMLRVLNRRWVVDRVCIVGKSPIAYP
jgi:hypothetical protein